MDSQNKKLPQVPVMRLIQRIPIKPKQSSLDHEPVDHTDPIKTQENDETVSSNSSAHLSSVVLGTGINLKTDEEEEVVIGDVERRGGGYILGQPRTGKSTLLVNMIEQDIAHGHGLCFIDPHGDGIEEGLKHLPDDRLDDVILLDPLDGQYTVGFKLFACQ